MSKKIISLVLAIVICFSNGASAFAVERQNPYDVEAQYVEELVSISDEELDKLNLKEAKALFEEAFQVSAENYSEDEIRLALDGLSFGLKFESRMNEIKDSGIVEIEPVPASTRSTTSGKTYSGDVGVAWIRDTTKGHSPLTLGEILSGTFTLEVDYLTWDSVASILAASASYSAFKDLTELTAEGAGGGVLGAYISKLLKLKGSPASIAVTVVGIALGFGWNWLQKIDRARMHDYFSHMSKNQYMKVEFMWSSNAVNKLYTNVSKTKTIPNPFPGKYGDWHIDRYGYYYRY